MKRKFDSNSNSSSSSSSSNSRISNSSSKFRTIIVVANVCCSLGLFENDLLIAPCKKFTV